MQNNWLFVKICEWANPRLRFHSIFFIPTKTWKDYILLIGISQSIENISLLFFIVECIMLLLSSILSHFLQSQYLCYIRFTICSTFAFFNLSFSKKTTFLKEYSISAKIIHIFARDTQKSFGWAFDVDGTKLYSTTIISFSL